MATIREMLDKPEDHPGMYKAVFGVNMTIKAGGPGSGRKPSWGSNTKNTDKLNSFHNNLVSRGYQYSHSGGKPESDKGRGHTYINKDKGEQKHFVEYANGNHTRFPSQKVRLT